MDGFIYQLGSFFAELPWDKPSIDCHEYQKWKNGKCCSLPWTKLDIKALTFVKRLLCPAPSRRITVEHIRSHPWMSQKSAGCKFEIRCFHSVVSCVVNSMTNVSFPLSLSLFTLNCCVYRRVYYLHLFCLVYWVCREHTRFCSDGRVVSFVWLLSTTTTSPPRGLKDDQGESMSMGSMGAVDVRYFCDSDVTWSCLGCGVPGMNSSESTRSRNQIIIYLWLITTGLMWKFVVIVVVVDCCETWRFGLWITYCTLVDTCLEITWLDS